MSSSPTPPNLHLLLIFFHVFEILLPLASAGAFVVWFSVVSTTADATDAADAVDATDATGADTADAFADASADAFHAAAIRASGVRHHDTDPLFYATLVFSLFILSAGVGFLYSKWKIGQLYPNR